MITEENRNKNGRPVGSKNKVSSELRKTIQDFVENNQSELERRMSGLNDSEWVKHYTQLLRFVLPTLKSSTYEFGEDGFAIGNVLSQIRFEK